MKENKNIFKKKCKNDLVKNIGKPIRKVFEWLWNISLLPLIDSKDCTRKMFSLIKLVRKNITFLAFINNEV